MVPSLFYLSSSGGNDLRMFHVEQFNLNIKKFKNIFIKKRNINVHGEYIII